MSNSALPHRQQPNRLPRPWNSPGKNTGVGCYFLLQCMKVKSESEVAQSCQTLSNPRDCSLPSSSVHRIFQARVLEWGAIAFSEMIYSHLLNINKIPLFSILIKILKIKNFLTYNKFSLLLLFLWLKKLYCWPCYIPVSQWKVYSVKAKLFT